MLSTSVDALSRTVSASTLQSRAVGGGADKSQLAAARADFDPAVVNHVRAAGTVDTTGKSPDGRAATGNADDAKTADKPSASSDGKAGTDKVDDKKEEEQVRQMQTRDGEVRAHERAHAAAAGALGGAPSFTFERGPDGKSYAVAGEVQIDVSPVSDDPEATIRKMQQVKHAALAPRDPSGPDRAIAQTADAQILAAQRELATGSGKSADGSEQSGNVDATKTHDATRVGDAARTAYNAHERRSAGAANYQLGAAPARGAVIDVVS